MVPCATPPPQESLPQFGRKFPTMVILRADGTSALAARLTPGERTYMAVEDPETKSHAGSLLLGVDPSEKRPNAFPFAPPLCGDVYVYNAGELNVQAHSDGRPIFTAPRRVIPKTTWDDLIR
jgi:hypothetical protein